MHTDLRRVHSTLSIALFDQTKKPQNDGHAECRAVGVTNISIFLRPTQKDSVAGGCIQRLASRQAPLRTAGWRCSGTMLNVLANVSDSCPMHLGGSTTLFAGAGEARKAGDALLRETRRVWGQTDSLAHGSPPPENAGGDNAAPLEGLSPCQTEPYPWL